MRMGNVVSPLTFIRFLAPQNDSSLYRVKWTWNQHVVIIHQSHVNGYLAFTQPFYEIGCPLGNSEPFPVYMDSYSIVIFRQLGIDQVKIQQQFADLGLPRVCSLWPGVNQMRFCRIQVTHSTHFSYRKMINQEGFF